MTMITAATISNAIFSLILVIGLILITAWLWRVLRDYRARMPPAQKLNFLAPLTPNGLTHIEVLETRMIDFKRKLILIRRDHVCHLLLCGDGRDIVIETGIPYDANPYLPEPNAE